MAETLASGIFASFLPALVLSTNIYMYLLCVPFMPGTPWDLVVC